MTDLDALAPNYRDAVRRWPGAVTLANGYDALVLCFSAGSHGLVEHVKSFIESVCRTIMVEHGERETSRKATTTSLLVAALRSVGVENTRGADELDSVLSGFNKLSDALTAMRNSSGPVAHGRDGFLDPVALDHARAYLHVGDAILGVLLSAVEGTEPNLKETREPYDTFRGYNGRIDRAVSVMVRVDDDADGPTIVLSFAAGLHEETIDLHLEPSRILYGADRHAYIEVLNRTNATGAVEGETREPVEEEAATDIEREEPSAGGSLEARVASPDILRSELAALLDSEEVTVTTGNGGNEQLVDSLLAGVTDSTGLDWKHRGSLQARLRLSSKRVLRDFGYPRQDATRLAEEIDFWLRERNWAGSIR